MNEEQHYLLKAARAYLVDYADDGHAIIPSGDLLRYGFSGPWLRDLEEVHRSRDDIPGGDISVSGKPVNEFVGVWSLDLLLAIVNTLEISASQWEDARATVGCSPQPM